MVMRLRGGQLYWSRIEETVKAMKPEEQEALYRILQNTQDEAKADGKREARRHPHVF
jgi:hypothetical protein